MAPHDLAAGEAESCGLGALQVPLDEREAASLARAFAAIADPVRLRLLAIVAAHGSVCSCDLEAPLGRSQPTISHHTHVLAEAGILVGQRRGRWMWWQVSPTRLGALAHTLATLAADASS